MLIQYHSLMYLKLISIMLINLLPLFGYIFFDWDALITIIYYFIESSIILIATFAKVRSYQNPDLSTIYYNGKPAENLDHVKNSLKTTMVVMFPLMFLMMSVFFYITFGDQIKKDFTFQNIISILLGTILIAFKQFLEYKFMYIGSDRYKTDTLAHILINSTKRIGIVLVLSMVGSIVIKATEQFFETNDLVLILLLISAKIYTSYLPYLDKRWGDSNDPDQKVYVSRLSMTFNSHNRH